ncbi:hypothetical protein [Bradyrhizobium sp. WD16]|uniref:hypothetical protein n=1 Tax=Bradyrhizobium sp. WD16 TaxID=1521768 RepID=UPI0020A4E682|nr:hypothetical protein [Bradyrhizobium sp. WD16]
MDLTLVSTSQRIRRTSVRSPAPGAARLAVVELVEIAHRLHDRLEIGARVERFEQFTGVGKQRMRALQGGAGVSSGASESRPWPDSRMVAGSDGSRRSDWM